MLTDRMSSGPSHMGDLNMVGALNRRTNIQEKGPESFAALIEKSRAEEESRAPQKTQRGQNEAGSRTDKDLSVRRRESGPSERAPASKNKPRAPENRNASENSNERSTDRSEDEHLETTEHRSKKFEEHADAGKHKKHLSQRQKVMQEFMDSVESEFSIPPERMVEAMAQLNDKSLLKSPEETASQVISDLKLPPETADKVEARYVHMLAKLSDIENRRPEKMLEPTSEQLAMIQAAGGLAGLGAISSLKKGEDGQSIMVTVKDRQSLLRDSLAKMNDKFFLSGDVIQQAKSGEDYLGKLDSQSLDNPNLMNGQQALLGLDGQRAPVDVNQIRQMPGMNGQVKLSNEGYQELSEKLAAVGLTAGVLSQAIKGDPANKAALKMEQALQGSSGTSAYSLGGSNNLSMLMGAGAVGGSAASDGGGDEFSSSSGGGRESLDTGSGKVPGEFFALKDSGLVKPEFAAMGAAAGVSVAKSSEPSENIRQIMNQAQYVMKKGGGEAIVKLNPEGLGEVHLRVTVSEGKVNLQMSAETKEAKNLIESSIKDLQSSLGAHNLKVDHIKVDVGNQASSENGNTNHGFNFDQGREQARQFLGNFQEENFNNRSNFFEAPGLKAYNPNKGPEALKPSPESVTSRRYVGEGRGSGLNLIA